MAAFASPKPDTARRVHKLALDARISVRQIVVASEPEVSCKDYSYWTRTQPMAHLSCWIGLDASTRDNGCVHYVPGSQRWSLLPITGLAGDMEFINAVLNEEQRARFKFEGLANKE